MANKDFALIYLKNGLSVFPSRGKKPLVKWEPYIKKKPTPKQVDEWWTKWPDADIACATGKVSDLIVVDVDGGKVPPLPLTAVSETSPGHFQYFFKCPNFPVQNSTKVIAPNSDVRANGGFAVLPPSNHYDKTGGVDFIYTWKIPPKEAGFAELPSWILEKIKIRKPVSDIVLGVSEGSRNNDAASLIGSLLTKHPQSEWQAICWPLVKSWNTTNLPPLPEDELRSVFNSIAGRELQAQKIPTPSPLYTPTNEMVRVIEPILAKNLKTLTNIDVEWVTEGILAIAYITLLASREKLGKTTLLMALLKSLAGGTDFLGLSTKKTKTLIITEENPGIWNRRLEDMGLSNCETLWFIPQPFNTKLKQKEWEKWLIEDIAPFCKKNEIKALVIDTLSTLWPVQQENEVGETTAAYLPLRAITKEGVALLAIHHNSKAGEIRGSTQIAAFPDIILKFSKPQGDENTSRRVLRGTSRLEETPDQLLLDYQDGEYLLLGTPQNVDRQDKLVQVKKTLQRFPNGAVITEIIKEWVGQKKPSRTTLRRWLDELSFTRSIYQVGIRAITGGEATIYSLYPNQNVNGAGLGDLVKNEPKNPNHHDIGAYKGSASTVEDAMEAEDEPPF